MTQDPEPSEQHSPTISLLGRCKDGDSAALDELVRRFYAPVYRMIRARMGPVLSRKEGVEDLVQDTFLKVLKGLDSFEVRPDSHFIAYLAKVAKGTVVNEIDRYCTDKRDAGREISVEGMRRTVSESSFGFDLAGQSTSPGSKAANREIEEIVDACLAGLKDEYREVILLRDYAGADWEFIAEEFGRSKGAVQALYDRAKTRLIDAVRRLL